MAVVEKETFTIEWRIQNFHMCPHQSYDYFDSPKFVVNFLEKTEWSIRLYPRGQSHEDCISCYLQRNKKIVYSRYTFGFSLTVSSAQIDKLFKKEKAKVRFQNFTCDGFDDFINSADVFNTANGMLPNDTLTVKCCLWRDINQSCVADPAVSETKDHCCDPNASLNTRQCSAVTLIKSRSKSFIWPIKGFSVLQPNLKLMRTVISPVDDKASFDITLCMEGNTAANRCLEIDIRRTDASGLEKSIFIRGKIKILGSLNSVQLNGEDEHYFNKEEEDDFWKFPTFIKMKDLRDQNYLCHTDDILYLFFEFHHSAHDAICHFKDESLNLSVYHSENLNCFNCAKNEYLSLYRSGKYSDVTLQAGTKTFKVHKIILSLKSDVFCAMFESDMQEKARGVVEIDDFDSETVDRLLYFMYTDTLESLKQDDVLKLYSIAEKYNVVSLKCRCRCILMSMFSLSNICQILTLADLHQDDDLLEAVRCFIRTNSDTVFNAQNWRDFTKDNARLAAEIMLYILKNNFLS